MSGIKWSLLTYFLLLATSTASMAEQMSELPQSGATSVTSYYQFRPLETIDMGDLGVHNAHALHGITRNANGDPFFDGMKAHCVVHHQPMPDDFGIRYSCAFIDADGDRMYFLGEDHTGEGGPPTRAGGTGKYGNIDFEIPLLDVRLVFGPERQLEGLIVDYDIRWNSQ